MTLEDSSGCPTETELERLINVNLSDESTRRLEDHLSTCTGCQGRLDRLTEKTFSHHFAKSPADCSNDSVSLSQLIHRLQNDPLGETDMDSILDDIELPDHYEVIEQVAQGGMGIVFKAFDQELQRHVAIKVMSPALAGRRETRKRFLQEARAAAKLQHENIMPIHAVDQSGRLPYLVTPFAEGANLQERLEQTPPMSQEEILHLAYQLVSGLEAAHAHGVLHRDIKPANILLLEEGRRLWIADFGLAIASGHIPAANTGNSIAGTPAYMSPEQLKGKKVDERSDLYSLGCVLYAMATGRSPFEAETAEESMAHVAAGQYAPFSAIGSTNMPTWYQKMVGQLLSLDPDDRPKSAETVRLTFEKNRLRRTNSPLMAALIVAVIGLGAGVAWLLSGRQQPLPEGFVLIKGERSEIHATLRGAVESAHPGDTIEIRKQGLLQESGLEIDDLPLTIRAAEGYEPVLEAASDKTLLEVHGSICLEGLAFRHPVANSPHRSAPLMAVHSGAVFLANCQLVQPSGDRTRRIGQRFTAPPLLKLTDCEEVVITNCMVVAPGSTILDLRPPQSSPSSITLENNLMLALIGMRQGRATTEKRSWKLHRNTIAARMVLCVGARDAIAEPLQADLQNNVFEFSRYFLWLRDTAIKSLKMTGTGNLFRPEPRPRGVAYFVSYARNPDASRFENNSVRAIEDFAKEWGQLGDLAETLLFNRELMETYRGRLDSAPLEAFAIDSNAGIDSTTIGPGKAYDDWRRSQAYAAWAAKRTRVLLSGK